MGLPVHFSHPEYIFYGIITMLACADTFRECIHEAFDGLWIFLEK